MSEEIPDTVLQALNSVRRGGLTNMMAFQTVCILVEEFDDDSAEWLRANKSRYTEALKKRGERKGGTA